MPNRFVIPAEEPSNIPRRVLEILRQAGGDEVSVRAMCGRAQTPLAVEARRNAARSLRAQGYSFPQIGRWLGGRHHTSIIHLCRKQPRRRPSPVNAVIDIPVPDLSGEWAI